MAKKCHPLYKSMGKLLTFGIFIKSAVEQKNLKLGVVITLVISIIQKHSRCHSNMPRGSRPFDPGCGNHLYGDRWLYKKSGFFMVILSLQHFPGWLSIDDRYRMAHVPCTLNLRSSTHFCLLWRSVIEYYGCSWKN